MITGNKGEWSEIYALFKLLSDKILQPGDGNTQKLEGVFYPIIKVLRSENSGNYEYSIDDDLVIVSGGESIIRVPIKKLKEQSQYLLKTIKDADSAAFSIPIIEEFMREINCFSLKAGSSSKTDITIIIHDQRTNQQPTLGFSIKSQLGNPSTLLNAGKTTNFVYKIKGVNFPDSVFESINCREKIKSKIEAITDLSGVFAFYGTEKQLFANNLILIDSRMPELLGQLVFDFYTSGMTKMSDLVKYLEERNPLNFDTTNAHAFYTYKIKRFLTDIALGMMPSKVWTGMYDATGGYLIVKADGEVLCYHIYNRNEFEDYLLNNTKLDTASTTRHEFGNIYREGEDLFLKLNLQIRFIK